MPEPPFAGLRVELLRGGIAPYYVNRTLLELREHYADLEADALRAGLSPQEAAAEALAALGSEESIAGAVLARRELKVWSSRCPRAAGLCRLLGALAVAPVVPVVGLCTHHGSEIARWGISTGLSLLLTGAMLLTLQWLIITG
jgi:hypothetical protein